MQFDDTMLFELCCSHNCCTWEGACTALGKAAELASGDGDDDGEASPSSALAGRTVDEISKDLAIYSLYNYATQPAPSVRQSILKYGTLLMPNNVQELPLKLDGATLAQQLEVLCALEQQLHVTGLDRELTEQQHADSGAAGPGGRGTGHQHGLDLQGMDADSMSELLLRNSLLYEENVALKQQLGAKRERLHIQQLDAVHDSLVEQLYGNMAAMARSQQQQKKLKEELEKLRTKVDVSAASGDNSPSVSRQQSASPGVSRDVSSISFGAGGAMSDNRLEELKRMHAETLEEIKAQLRIAKDAASHEQKQRLEATQKLNIAEGEMTQQRKSLRSLEESVATLTAERTMLSMHLGDAQQQLHRPAQEVVAIQTDHLPFMPAFDSVGNASTTTPGKLVTSPSTTTPGGGAAGAGSSTMQQRGDSMLYGSMTGSTYGALSAAEGAGLTSPEVTMQESDILTSPLAEGATPRAADGGLLAQNEALRSKLRGAVATLKKTSKPGAASPAGGAGSPRFSGNTSFASPKAAGAGGAQNAALHQAAAAFMSPPPSGSNLNSARRAGSNSATPRGGTTPLLNSARAGSFGGGPGPTGSTGTAGRRGSMNRGGTTPRAN